MFALEDLGLKSEILKNYVPNYRLNLIDAGNVECLERFRTDLHEIFGMLKYRNQKTELLHSERILKKEVGKKNREESIDMCKALEDLYQDGIEQGRDAERLDIAKKLLGVLDDSVIAEKLGLSVEEILSLRTEK